MSDGYNLVQIEKQLRDLNASSGTELLELKKLEHRRANAEHALAVAEAKAFMAAQGTVAFKEAFVTQATRRQARAVRLIKVQVDYAKSKVRERENTRSSLQTQAKLVLEAMRLAGRGDGA